MLEVLEVFSGTFRGVNRLFVGDNMLFRGVHRVFVGDNMLFRGVNRVFIGVYMLFSHLLHAVALHSGRIRSSPRHNP